MSQSITVNSIYQAINLSFPVSSCGLPHGGVTKSFQVTKYFLPLTRTESEWVWGEARERLSCYSCCAPCSVFLRFQASINWPTQRALSLGFLTRSAALPTVATAGGHLRLVNCWRWINTTLTHRGRGKMTDIVQTTFPSTYSRINFSILIGICQTDQ